MIHLKDILASREFRTPLFMVLFLLLGIGLGSRPLLLSLLLWGYSPFW